MILKKELSESLQTWWDDQIYLGLRITEEKIHGSVIFVKIMAVFRKLDFTIFFKTLYLTSTWSIHALQYWTNLPIIDPEGIFQIGSFFGWKTAF